MTFPGVPLRSTPRAGSPAEQLGWGARLYAVRGTSPTVREGSDSVKPELMILAQQHILDCFLYICFLPQIHRASVTCPRFYLSR